TASVALAHVRICAPTLAVELRMVGIPVAYVDVERRAAQAGPDPGPRSVRLCKAWNQVHGGIKVVSPRGSRHRKGVDLVRGPSAVASAEQNGQLVPLGVVVGGAPPHERKIRTGARGALDLPYVLTGAIPINHVLERVGAIGGPLPARERGGLPWPCRLLSGRCGGPKEERTSQGTDECPAGEHRANKQA